jgi:hypothetical protein
VDAIRNGQIRNYKISIISSIYRHKISIFLFIDTKKLIDDFLSIIRYYRYATLIFKQVMKIFAFKDIIKILDYTLNLE